MKGFLQFLELAAKAIVLLAVLLWLSDWALFRIRAAHGDAFDTVLVNQYLSTALKGDKQEYDYLGSAQQPCARALFPHGGAPACWWLRRHTSQWE